MEEEQIEKTFKKKFGRFYNKNYKLLLLIPVLVLIFSFIYMGIFYANTGEIVYRDFTLAGGTSVTIIGDVNGEALERDLMNSLDEINIRQIYDISTREQTALVVETKTEINEVKEVLENYLGYNLDEENSSFEFTEPKLGETFYKQLLTALFFAFFFMALIVFVIFRSFVPSVAVIISAFADIFMTLTLVNILGIKLSSGGLVAFLLLIGYSVDTDILLTNRLLKRSEGSVNERIFSSFKTGMTMTLTSLLAVSFALFISMSFSNLLTQIFTILAIGLGFDMFNTWTTNASLLKWYVSKNEN
jgi:preprotein translocase subunit SecF